MVVPSVAHQVYGATEISERHRHRYEVNNDYRDILDRHGMRLSGFSPDNLLVEMIELPEHPWFVGGQFHPEFKSSPKRPHPLFREFIKASLQQQQSRV
jgi:CTP synthase